MTLTKEQLAKMEFHQVQRVDGFTEVRTVYPSAPIPIQEKHLFGAEARKQHAKFILATASGFLSELGMSRLQKPLRKAYNLFAKACDIEAAKAEREN